MPLAGLVYLCFSFCQHIVFAYIATDGIDYIANLAVCFYHGAIFSTILDIGDWTAVTHGHVNKF